LPELALLGPAGRHRESLIIGFQRTLLAEPRRTARGCTDLGRREGGSVYKPTPTIDLILRADDDFIGIAIHGDEALGFLNLLHQFVDGHGLGLHWQPSPGCAGLRR
jgi:hypothetical protein